MERYMEEAETFIKLDTYQLWISPSGEYIEKFEHVKKEEHSIHFSNEDRSE